jgi:hypothetical protein
VDLSHDPTVALQRRCSARMEGTSTEEDLLKREIEDLPVVSSLSFIRKIGRDKAGYRVNLFCDAASLYGGCKDGACTVKRVGPVRMSTKHPTMRDCWRTLLARIQQDHGSDCVAAVQVWQTVSRRSGFMCSCQGGQDLCAAAVGGHLIFKTSTEEQTVDLTNKGMTKDSQRFSRWFHSVWRTTGPIL